MWFAGFQDYQSHPWLFHLAAKLLVNDKNVSKIMLKNPFMNREPPRYIRAEHYRYRYAPVGSSQAKAGQWWIRSRVGSYMYPVSLSSLKPLLKNFGWEIPSMWSEPCTTDEWYFVSPSVREWTLLWNIAKMDLGPILQTGREACYAWAKLLAHVSLRMANTKLLFCSWTGIRLHSNAAVHRKDRAKQTMWWQWQITLSGSCSFQHCALARWYPPKRYVAILIAVQVWSEDTSYEYSYGVFQPCMSRRCVGKHPITFLYCVVAV